MSDQVKATAKNRRWPRRLLLSAILAFVALQAHSYYYLRFMVMNPFSAAYEPSMPIDPVASKRADILRGLITPVLQSVNVARMHWASLSQSPPQFKGLTLVKGRELEQKIFGYSGRGSRPGYNWSFEYKRSQFFEGHVGTSYDTMSLGVYVIFYDKVCKIDSNSDILCISVYRNNSNKNFQYTIKSNILAYNANVKWGDEK